MLHDYVKQSGSGTAKCGAGTSPHNIMLCSTYFGLADLGFGCPELGTFSLSELASVRLPFGLGIERSVDFGTAFPISAWAAWSRRAGSILWAETLLRRASRVANDDELPPPGG